MQSKLLLRSIHALIAVSGMRWRKNQQSLQTKYLFYPYQDGDHFHKKLCRNISIMVIFSITLWRMWHLLISQKHVVSMMTMMKIRQVRVLKICTLVSPSQRGETCSEVAMWKTWKTGIRKNTIFWKQQFKHLTHINHIQGLSLYLNIQEQLKRHHALVLLLD